MPVLYIEYKARALSNINAEPLADVKFSTEYSMSIASTQTQWAWVFWLGLGGTLLLAGCASC